MISYFRKLNFVFFGSPEFAAIILEKLINAGFVPEAIVCNPDKPVGRKRIITPPPVKTRIMNYESRIKHKITILQPEILDENFRNSLFTIHDSFDFFLVAAYAKIIPKKILGVPHLGTIGVHPSLLPKYRGSSPIQTVILNGETETGTTLFLIDEKMDHGPIIAKSEIRISKSEAYEALMKKLAELSAEILIETLPNIEEKIKNATPQNEAMTTYTKKIKTEDAYIEPEILAAVMQEGEPRSDKREKAIEIDRKIRALNPEPGAWTIKDSRRMKILESELSGDGKLLLKKIQFEGGKPVLL